MSTLDRRKFLGATLAAPFALAAQDSKPAAPRPQRTLKKAVMWGMIGEGKSILEKFELLRDCGFDGVEMDSPSEAPPAEILAAQEKTGVKAHGLVDSVHWRLPLTHPSADVRAKGLAALLTALRDAQRYGSTSVLLVPGIVDRTQPYDLAYERAQTEIKKALPLAAECEVKIGIENVWNNFLLSPLEACRFVDEFASPWVGWHLDLGNVVTYGWPEQWVRILGKRTCKLHLKEYSNKRRDNEGRWKGFEVDLLEGDNHWPSILKALDETGYSTATPGNWATAEIRGGDRKRLAEVAQKIDQVLAL